MQLPVVVHLPPTTFSGHAYDKSADDRSTTGDRARISLNAARHHMMAAEFFSKAVGDHEDEDKQLRELLLQQQRDGIHGKVHFFSLPQSHILLLQRHKNEAPVEQRLLHWANTRTHRHATLCARPSSNSITALFLSGPQESPSI